MTGERFEWRAVPEGPRSLAAEYLYVDGEYRGSIIFTGVPTFIGYANGERLGHWLDEAACRATILRKCGVHDDR